MTVIPYLLMYSSGREFVLMSMTSSEILLKSIAIVSYSFGAFSSSFRR